MARRGPAMTDVARLAGVSHQTVSRVLNGHPKVSKATRARVHAAIEQLGYRRNQAARALATGTSRLMGVIAHNTTFYGTAALLSALELAAAQDGFTLAVATVRRPDPADVAAAVHQHLEHGVAGLVLLLPVDCAAQALDDIPDDVPVVTVDGDPQRCRTLVAEDQEAGAGLATRRLLQAGHSTVWHVSGPQDCFDAVGRITGWRRALQEVGADVPPLMTSDWTAASGYRAGQVLAADPAVTALFAANDHLALGVLRALHEHGRRVPGEVSVIGHDDVPESAYFFPPLTTVRPDRDALARTSVDLLLQQIASPAAARACQQHILTPVLVERDSVAPPPPGT